MYLYGFDYGLGISTNSREFIQDSGINQEQDSTQTGRDTGSRAILYRTDTAVRCPATHPWRATPPAIAPPRPMHTWRAAAAERSSQAVPSFLY